jgi:hypothetical protein
MSLHHPILIRRNLSVRKAVVIDKVFRVKLSGAFKASIVRI